MSFQQRFLRIAIAVGLGLTLTACQDATLDRNKPDEDESAIPASSLNRGLTLAQLTGGDLGIGGGYLLAAAPDKIRQREHDLAMKAAHKGEQSPAPLESVRDTETADLNKDGFVTLDEVVAMARAGLREEEIVERLKRTNYVFQMTLEQERYLTDRGVGQTVVNALHRLSVGTSPAKPTTAPISA